MAKEARTPSAMPSGRFLVVDDDPSARFARVRTLRQRGHTVFEAGRLGEAEILIREVRPEVVVLDVNLPDGDGVDFCRRLKSDDQLRSVMVLQMSASFVTHEDQVRGLDAGADAYLVEPAAPGVLLATAGALLRLSRAERALQDTIVREQAAREEAEAANRVKDDFLATLSHELRTPLHAIIGWTALMRTRTLDDQAHRRALEVIERNAKAQAALIEDLLDVSRITLGQLQLTWGTVDLAPVVAAALDTIRQTAEAKGLHLTAAFDLDPDVVVRGDPVRLQQVFWNLLSNAVKFTPPGGRIELRAYADERHACIEVVDNGRGISAEFLPRVFDKFRRASRGQAEGDRGLGLGLSIAHDVVELHGGSLTASSEGLDRGATFVVTLPRQAAAVSRTMTAAPQRTSS